MHERPTLRLDSDPESRYGKYLCFGSGQKRPFSFGRGRQLSGRWPTTIVQLGKACVAIVEADEQTRCRERREPWRKVGGKSTGSIKLYSSPLLRCIKALQVSASKKSSEPRISSVPFRTEKTASVPATVHMQPSRDSVFHLFSSRKAAAGEIGLMIAALHWKLDTHNVPLSHPYTCRM